MPESLAEIRLDALTDTHLSSLVDEAVPEGRRLEYKVSVGTDDAAKREFLADVSSFANAAGGDIVIGIGEKEGAAEALVGLPSEVADQEVLRLESILRDGLEPRIPGLQSRAIPVTEDRVVLVIRVPRSWAAPHMVKFRGTSRFFSRTSAGKYQLDVSEIRGAFVGSENARTFLRSFRMERLGRVAANDGPVPLLPRPKTVLHLIPLSAPDPSMVFEVTVLGERHFPNFGPLKGTAWDTRINFDGALAYLQPDEAGDARSYTQVFRNGAIEGVDATMLGRVDRGGRDYIPSLALEGELIGALGRYLALLSELDVSGPFVLGVSLLEVRGLKMAVGQHRFDEGHAIDRDDLIISESLIEELTEPPDLILKPHLDAIWNATGYSGSHNYDEHGRWHDR